MPKIPNRAALEAKVIELSKKTPRPSIQQMADKLGVSRSFVTNVLREASKKPVQEHTPTPDGDDDGAAGGTAATTPPAESRIELHDDGAAPRMKPAKKTVQEDTPTPSETSTPAAPPAAPAPAEASPGGVNRIRLC